MILECQNLSKSYGGVHALSDVSLVFPNQGVVAVIGPNGAGKTTLIDTLTGIVRPDSGRWLLSGQDVTGFDLARIAQLGIVRSFQGIRLLTNETVLDNLVLAMPARGLETLSAALLLFPNSTKHKSLKEKAHILLESVGLASLQSDLVGALSYGDQKLVSVAVAAATEASVLLLDEPVAGVHGTGVDRIVRLVKDLAIAGRTIIFVEHDMSVVRQLAETVILLDHGKVLAAGAPSEVFAREDLLEAYLG